MIKTGVLGSGWHEANAALLKLLVHHPDVELKWVCGDEDDVSNRLDDIIPSLKGETSLECTEEPAFDDVDVVFVALESPLSLDQVVEEMNGRFKVIALYDPIEEPAPAMPELLYGIPELNRKHIVHDCNGVICPNPIAYIATLALLPLAKNLMLNSDITIAVIEGHKTATNGLSAELRRDTLYAQQIADELRNTLQTVQTSFNKRTNLIHFVNDATDASIATITVDCNTYLDVVKSLYEDYYDDHNFVFLTDETDFSCLELEKSSKCLLLLERNEGKLIITVALDNVCKATVGVAVHNMNLLFGLHERVGLLAF